MTGAIETDETIGRARVLGGDCVAVMRALAAAGTRVQAVVTDPPYHLTEMTRRFGKPGSAPPKAGATGAYARAARGFMGQAWDGGDVAFRAETWAAAFDLLPPGGHLLAFAGTRGYHRLACAVEDAGFEVRDMIAWLYGTGFPKSHDVAKAIDKAAGAEREVVGAVRRRDIRNGAGRARGSGIHAASRGSPEYMDRPVTRPATEAAEAWEGWGTALKPALEPIVVARKPLAGTVAETVQAHGTGALNVRGGAIPAEKVVGGGVWTEGTCGLRQAGAARPSAARWPANVVHDGGGEVLDAFDGFAPGAGRFFYCAKATAAERLGSRHPTVKPLALMRWLVRLVTPPGGVVLDPFAGTGTTGAAADIEGVGSLLIEREAEYRADIRRRLSALRGGDAGLFARGAG